MSAAHIARRLVKERRPLKHPLYQAGQRGELSLAAPVTAGAAE